MLNIELDDEALENVSSSNKYAKVWKNIRQPVAFTPEDKVNIRVTNNTSNIVTNVVTVPIAVSLIHSFRVTFVVVAPIH